jgi:hypothetical protein
MVTGRHTPELLRLELPENSSMLLKPGATVDGKPDYGRWGETVVVRAGGGQRLGTRPQELYELT